MARLAHDVALLDAGQRRRRGMAGPQAVAGEGSRVPAERRDVVLHQERHRPVCKTLATNVAAAIDGTEDRPVLDVSSLKPGRQRPDWVGVRVLTEGNADLTPRALLAAKPAESGRG